MSNNTQKKIVVLKTPDSRFFEQAHLILRDHVEYNEKTMAEEANRIVARAQSRHVYQKTKKEPSPLFCRIGWFFLGIFTATAIMALTALLF